VDWDEDGRKDLILGERDGYIRIYLNTNTDADPVFNGYDNLLLNGNTYDVGYSSSPDICDWDNDGKKDLLVGDDNGYVYLLINTGTNGAPLFTTAVQIQNGLSALDVGSRASPFVFDWNGDGKKDLLVGETYGNLHYFENIGSDEAPVFDGTTTLETYDGVVIDVGHYSRFVVCDWNNDAINDIVCGYYDTSSSPTGGVRVFLGGYDLFADLAVVSFSGPAQALPGQEIGDDVDLRIVNQGNVRCTSFEIQFYLSSDADITTSDEPLVLGEVDIPSLEAGEEIDVTANAGMAIPADTPIGTYYIGPLVDYKDVISESDENNNATAQQILVDAVDPIPDIKIDGKDGTVVVQQTAEVSLTVSLLDGEMQGDPQDWWVIAKKGGSYYSWVFTVPWHWVPGVSRTYVGPLFDLAPYELHYGTIPVGTWNITFAVDAPDNIFQGTYMDEGRVISF